MHLVEILRHGVDLGPAMAQMRAWLDHRHAEPSLFELAFLPDREIRFRLQFQDARDALAFAGVFDGEVVSQPATAMAA
jgi:hypothetical protein